MKKLTYLILLCLCAVLFLPVYAESDDHYSFYHLDEAALLSKEFRSADIITVTKEFTYNGITYPADSIPWQESFDGIAYSGTLSLISFCHINESPSDSYTDAVYQGTLRKVPIDYNNPAPSQS